MITHINSEIIDRLYRLAPRLRSEWPNVPLREDFDTSMILAVVKTLESVGVHRKDGTSRTPAEQAKFAEKLLRSYWRKSAARDQIRYAQKRANRNGHIISLEDVTELQSASSLYDALSHDISGGEAGREVARFLEGNGWPREQAWAMVWWLTGRPWDDIAWLLEDRFEVALPTETVRQWQRKFARVMPQVRDHLSDTTEEGSSGHPHADEMSIIQAHKNKLLSSSTKLEQQGIQTVKRKESNYVIRKSGKYTPGGIRMKNIINAIAIKDAQIAVLIAGVSLSVLFASGCSRSKQGDDSRSTPPGLTVIGGVDASASWRGRLGQGVMCLATQAQTMDASRDKMVLYRMDRTAEEFTGEDALSDPDGLEDEIIHQLQARPQVNGTFPAVYFRQATDMAATATGPVTVELMSDADNDDASSKTRAELRRIGAALAKNPKVKAVWFFGITRDNTAYWRDVFSALGNRMHFCSSDEMTSDRAIKALPSH